MITPELIRDQSKRALDAWYAWKAQASILRRAMIDLPREDAPSIGLPPLMLDSLLDGSELDVAGVVYLVRALRRMDAEAERGWTEAELALGMREAQERIVKEE